MNRLQHLSIGFSALRQHPLRTLLSTLGVIAGVGALVAVLSLGDGMEDFARRQVAETTKLQVATIVPRTTTRLDGITVPLEDVVAFKSADAADAFRAIPGLTYCALQISGGLLLQVGGGPDRGVAISGVAAVGDGMPRAPVLVAGAFLSTEQMGDTIPHAVVTLGLARLLAPDTPEALVGDTARLGNRVWTIVGIVADEKALSAWVPHDLAGEAMTPGGSRRISTMVLAADGIETAAVSAS